MLHFGSEPAVDENEDAGGYYNEPDQAHLVGLQDWYRKARDFRHQWGAEARDWFDFAAGTQWSEADVAQLREQLRPVITFDRIGPVLKTVSGLEISNRQETAYLPRQFGQQGLNDLLTSAARFFRGECDAEDEESDAFIDVAICGMGWTETRLSFDDDPEGALIIERTDPLEMYWDPTAKKRNLKDRRYHFRVKDVAIEAARTLVPGAPDTDLDAQWADDTGSSQDPHNAQQAPFYRVDQSTRIDKGKDQVRLVWAEWYDWETMWRTIDLFTKKLISLGDEEYRAYSTRISQLGWKLPEPVKMRRKVYKRALLGAKILKLWKGPKEGFALKCMTGERDRNKNTWYGLVKAMMDPQRWANKWLSQSLHILNTGAKGGTFAEEDAFEDWDEAMEQWASPDAIVKVAAGAIQNNKLKDRPVVQVPAGLENLLQLALSSIRDGTGVNLEALGQQTNDQSGILEHIRKQAAMTVLAGMFNALRRYRKEQGKLMLYYITNFLSDGRLIRIGGPENYEYVQLVHQNDNVEYDVIVDETPTSPNMKEQVWGTLTQLMPFMKGMGIPPQAWLALMKYSPLPASVVAEFEQEIQKASQNQPPNPQVILANAKANESQGKTALYFAQAQNTAAEGQTERLRLHSENLKTMADLKHADIDAENAKAEVEQKRSAAILNLAKAESAASGIPLDQLMGWVELLDQARQWHQMAQDRQIAQQQQQQSAQAA